MLHSLLHLSCPPRNHLQIHSLWNLSLDFDVWRCYLFNNMQSQKLEVICKISFYTLQYHTIIQVQTKYSIKKSNTAYNSVSMFKGTVFSQAEWFSHNKLTLYALQLKNTSRFTWFDIQMDKVLWMNVVETLSTLWW